MRARAWLLAVVCCACSATPRAATPSGRGAHLSAPLEAVGRTPRVIAVVDLRDARIQARLAELAPLLGRITGHSPMDCKIALDRLESFRMAVGEPLKVSLEIDGAIDAKSIACMLGDDRLAEVTKAGFAIRDRPGGIAIERDLERAAPSGLGADLAARCAGRPGCVVARLGPAAREAWLELSCDGTAMLARRSGHDVASASAMSATIAELGDLVETVPIPPSSSMVPTLVGGDHVVALKGRWRGPIVPGMVVAHRWSDGRTFIKRVVAVGGQTVAETERGIAIDGVPLVTEEVASDYAYVYDFGPGSDKERSGKVVREHLGARSYLTLHRKSPQEAFARSRQRGSPGAWTIPSGHVFVLGDNRDDSTDSRYIGAIKADAIVGQVVAIGLAMRDGEPDWERTGSPVE